MWERLGEQKEVRYNSRTDKQAPPGHEAVAESNRQAAFGGDHRSHGLIIEQVDAASRRGRNESQIAVPRFPSKPFRSAAPGRTPTTPIWPSPTA